MKELFSSYWFSNLFSFQNEDTITISVEDVNERPTEIAMVAKRGGVGVDFETDQPVIMENTERGATVAQMVVLDPDLHEEMTVLLSSYVVAVGSMSCLSLTKVTALLSILSALSTPPPSPPRVVLDTRLQHDICRLSITIFWLPDENIFRAGNNFPLGFGQLIKTS